MLRILSNDFFFFTEENVPYDTLHEDSIKVSRRKTDSRVLKFYLIFLIVWLGTTACGNFLIISLSNITILKLIIFIYIK